MSAEINADRATGGYPVRAELPGTVSYVVVTAGLEVEAGAPLLLLDSMKMEIPVLAPRAGTVRRVVVGPGDQVQQGDLVVMLDPVPLPDVVTWTP